jgi:predicted RNA-binding Zn ribbon-like protein
MAPGDAIPGKTAPAPLTLVQAFVNSVNLESGEDELTSPEALRLWLAERGLIEPGRRVTRAELERAIDVREGLRALLRANNGLPLDEDRVERLDRAAGRAGLHVGFGADGEPELVPGRAGVDGAIARLMAIVAGAVERGSWERLKACPREDCEWAFFDRSKNRSGRWCRMELCGNMAKARRFRERRRATRRGGP